MSPPADHAELEELLAHAAWVRRLARTLVRDASAADDVVQETWLAALRGAPRAAEGHGADRAALRPWLARVARNAARRLGRAEARRRERERTAARADAQSRVLTIKPVKKDEAENTIETIWELGEGEDGNTVYMGCRVTCWTNVQGNHSRSHQPNND